MCANDWLCSNCDSGYCNSVWPTTSLGPHFTFFCSPTDSLGSEHKLWPLSVDAIQGHSVVKEEKMGIAQISGLSPASAACCRASVKMLDLSAAS